MKRRNEEERPTPAGMLSPAARIVLILLPLTAVLIALCAGRMSVPLEDILRSVANRLGGAFPVEENYERVIWNMRMPRILTALLVGGGLSAAGCAFQSLFANPLATPDTVGVASGASFGAALGILLGCHLAGIQVLSLIFGVVAVVLTWLGGQGQGMSAVVLSGIMMGSLFNALLSLVKFLADTESQLPAITYWLMGSLSAAGYKTLAVGAPIILAGILVLYLLRWRMNLLPLPEDEIAAAGVHVRGLRVITVLCATAITAACVSMCGQVGWVGLLVPHICRMKFGNDHLSLLPASVAVGAAFLVVVDTLARSISAAELPVSILTAIVGAPFFLYLMRRSGGWRL